MNEWNETEQKLQLVVSMATCFFQHKLTISDTSNSFKLYTSDSESNSFIEKLVMMSAYIQNEALLYGND